MDPLTQNPLPNLVPPAQVPASMPPAGEPLITAEPVAAQEAQDTPIQNIANEVATTLRNSKNVLVTVGINPSVDELAAALGLTFLLGKLDKHATAVFSGKIPPAIEFLDPEQTFEETVDSLRDFIIALDKEKADKLRYKVEDDVVKVFITPYRTIISEKDLEFSQGDYNVDVVVALGVAKQEELDGAIASHGRILHDATVVTLNAGEQVSTLGSTNWQEPEASSIAEMIVTLHDFLGGDMLDSQVSTALLTGIVAETNRFSNDKTTPKVMNIAAQLMAAGANQQLVATNLRQEGMLSQSVRAAKQKDEGDDDGEMVLDHNADKETEKPSGDSKRAKKLEKTANSELAGSAVKKTEVNKDKTPKKVTEEQQNKAAAKVNPPLEATKAADESQKLSEDEDASQKVQNSTLPKIESLPSLSNTPDTAQSSGLPSLTSLQPVASKSEADKPAFGGTLNATTEEAEQSKAAQAEKEASENHTTLSHDSHGEAEEVLDDARKAVEEAAEAVPFDPANKPLESINAAPLPSLEDSLQPVDTNVSQVQAQQFTPIGSEVPSPMDAFMQPQTNPNGLTEGFNIDQTQATGVAGPQTPPLPPVDPSGLPPLPPLPTAPIGSAPPSVPPLPGQPLPPVGPAIDHQINPGFMQDMPQSQNSWTQAGDDLVAKQAEKQATRDAKAAEKEDNYNQTVDRQRELQGLPPLNDPNGSGLPPLPPV